MIRTVTETTWAMMIDSQAPVQIWGDAVKTAVYLHERPLNKGLKRQNDHDGNQEPYKTPFKMLHGFGKSMHESCY